MAMYLQTLTVLLWQVLYGAFGLTKDAAFTGKGERKASPKGESYLRTLEMSLRALCPQYQMRR